MINSQSILSQDIHGRLFAGLADGHVIVFNHTLLSSSAGSSDNGPGMMWCKSKGLTMEKRQCNVLELVPEREEVWIACGNRLRILCTKVSFIKHVSNSFVLTEHPLAEFLIHKAVYRFKQG